MNLPKLHFHLIVPCHIYFSSTCRNSLLLDIYQKIIILTVSYDIIHSWNSNICTLHVIIHSWNSNICKLHVQKPPPQIGDNLSKKQQFKDGTLLCFPFVYRN